MGTPTENIRLYGDDADQFREIKKALKEKRNGNEPSNPEVVRRLMEETSIGQYRAVG